MAIYTYESLQSVNNETLKSKCCLVCRTPIKNEPKYFGLAEGLTYKCPKCSDKVIIYFDSHTMRDGQLLNLLEGNAKIYMLYAIRNNKTLICDVMKEISDPVLRFEAESCEEIAG